MVTGMKHRSSMVWPVRDGNGPKRLFRTGQQACYDEQGNIVDCMHTGQDAAVRSGIEWPVPRLMQSGDVVVDRQTGLSWTQNANIGIDPVSWNDAFAVVEKLNRINAFGFSDWRLPSIIELESLADMGKHSPALPDPTIFTDIRDFYWSSTTSRYEERYAWALYLQDGAVGVGFKPLTEFFVWAVRG
jgi:formylglycine-generating enzyme required for sulfatase activity